VKLIARLYDPTEVPILLVGIDMRQYSLDFPQLFHSPQADSILKYWNLPARPERRDSHRDLVDLGGKYSELFELRAPRYK
jgi:hypothetical protein